MPGAGPGSLCLARAAGRLDRSESRRVCSVLSRRPHREDLPATEPDVPGAGAADPREQVHADLVESHARVIALIEQVGDEELLAEKHFGRTGSTGLGAYCVSATSSHSSGRPGRCAAIAEVSGRSGRSRRCGLRPGRGRRSRPPRPR
ncbi:MAG: ClbS/DfsB family four-helix bundle protein [Propionibacteriaceae bacterium]|nr:ClbS/DfsB family four-helix bundle protein [Propionibacteriaceae bacterium]